MILGIIANQNSRVRSTYLATASASGLSGPQFYATPDFTTPADLTGYTTNGFSCAWSPDGTYFAMGDSNGAGGVHVWRTSDWSLVTLVTNPTSKVFHLVFSPDSSMLAVGIQASPYIQVYNTSDWSAKADPVSLPSGTVVGVAFSPDSSKLSVSTAGSTIKIYATSGMTVVAGTPGDNTQNQTVFTADGLYFMTSRNAAPYLRVYDVATWSLVSTPTTTGMAAPARRMVISPSGRWMAFSTSTPTVHVYDTATWTQVTLPAMTLTTSATVSFSNDEEYLAVASNHSVDYLLSVGSWAINSTITGSNTPLGEEIAFSPF